MNLQRCLIGIVDGFRPFEPFEFTLKPFEPSDDSFVVGLPHSLSLFSAAMESPESKSIISMWCLSAFRLTVDALITHQFCCYSCCSFSFLLPLHYLVSTHQAVQVHCTIVEQLQIRHATHEAAMETIISEINDHENVTSFDQTFSIA